jgi:hypothetical protein
VRPAVGLLAAGAVLGTLLDGVHVATATTRYTHPVALGLAWWVPLMFAGATLAIGTSHRLVDHLLARDVRPSSTSVAAGLVLVLALWATSGIVKPAGAALWILAPASVAMWVALDRTVVGLGLAIATAVSGVVVESTLVSLGVFSYVAPDAGRVASWLPWLYVAASVAVGNFARWLAAPESIPARPLALTRAPSTGTRAAR